MTYRMKFTFVVSLLCNALLAHSDDHFPYVDVFKVQSNAGLRGLKLNGVPHTKFAVIPEASACLKEFSAHNASEPTCGSGWRSFSIACDNQIKDIVKRMSVADDGQISRIDIISLNREGALAVFAEESRLQGSGGGISKWAFYSIRHSISEPLKCPTEEILSGTEAIPGGTTWVRSVCKSNESEESCISRMVFPNTHAVRIKFTSSGPIKARIPPGTKGNSEVW